MPWDKVQKIGMDGSFMQKAWVDSAREAFGEAVVNLALNGGMPAAIDCGGEQCADVPEHRAMSLESLKKVDKFVRSLATKLERPVGNLKVSYNGPWLPMLDDRNGWKCSTSQEDCSLNPDPKRYKPCAPTAGECLYAAVPLADVNLYVVNKLLVEPMTAKLGCSFASLVGSGKPTYFISHFWSARYAKTLSMIEEHHMTKKHAATDKVYYWICTFANNQHNLDALQVPVDETPFVSAIKIANEVLAVQDDELARQRYTLRRPWCVLEFEMAYETSTPFYFGCSSTGAMLGPKGYVTPTRKCSDDMVSILQHFDLKNTDGDDSNKDRVNILNHVKSFSCAAPPAGGGNAQDGAANAGDGTTCFNDRVKGYGTSSTQEVLPEVQMEPRGPLEPVRPFELYRLSGRMGEAVHMAAERAKASAKGLGASGP